MVIVGWIGVDLSFDSMLNFVRSVHAEERFTGAITCFLRSLNWMSMNVGDPGFDRTAVEVDVSLVSRVLRGDPKARISDEKREKILSIARSTNYRPNRMARSLRTRRMKILAMLTPDITNPFHSFLFRAVERTASAEGYDVILCNTDDSAARFKEGRHDPFGRACRWASDRAAQHTDPTIDRLRKQGLPFVLINRRRDGNADPWIGPDDFRTGWLGGHHLAKLGPSPHRVPGRQRQVRPIWACARQATASR